MATRPAKDLQADLSSHLRYTDATRRRSERLFRRGELHRKDLEVLYSGLFLDAFTGFERFIEELFIGLLGKKVGHRLRSVKPRAVFTSSAALWNIVVGPRFADWLPYDKTESRAEAFFEGGIPFSRLEKADKGRLEALLSIRHVLAHKSHHSMRQFEKKVLLGLSLTTMERTPAGFLRSVYMSAPAKTRYEEAVQDLQKIAHKLC